MPFRQVPQGSEDGFTLVEVLLAVALVAMMATLVFGSLYATTSAIDAARTQSANEQIVRSTLRVMTDELSVSAAPTKDISLDGDQCLVRRSACRHNRLSHHGRVSRGGICQRYRAWFVSSTPEKAIASFDSYERISMV